MIAGHELDVAVLEKVFDGWVCEIAPNTWQIGFGAEAATHQGIVPRRSPYTSPEAAVVDSGSRFSRDDRAAMRVVDELVRRDFAVRIETVADFGEAPRGWFVEFGKHGPDHFHRWGTQAHSDRRVAICGAALAAVRRDE